MFYFTTEQSTLPSTSGVDVQRITSKFTVFMIIPVYLEVSGEFEVIIPFMTMPFSALLR